MNATPACRATQIGSWPGTDLATALGVSLELTPDLPVLPELPGRGAPATMIGRTAGLLVDIPVDLQPSGWRIAAGAARDQRVARAVFREDLDALEEAAQGYVGPLKLALAGPWTLAASLEQTRGDKVLADHGARRELAESLAQGIGDIASELERRLPDIEQVWQLDEPLVSQVAHGAIGTASGFSRLRGVRDDELVELLDLVLAGPGSRRRWIHSCAADLPWDALLRTSADGLAVDAGLVSLSGWDALGAAVEQGRDLVLGLAATSGPVPTGDELADRTVRRWESLGLDEAALGRLWLTPTCGLAGRAEADARATLRALGTAVGIVTERVLGG